MHRALRLTLVLTVAGVSPLIAQGSRGLRIEPAALFVSLSGDDFQTTDAGFGLDAQVRFRMGQGATTLGAGLQYSSHNDDALGTDVSVMGLFVEPRYSFTSAGSMTPFIGARLGYLRRSATSGGVDASGSGFLYGGTGGMMFRAGPSMNVVIAVVFAGASFGDVEANGSTVAGSEASGTALALRGGISIGL